MKATLPATKRVSNERFSRLWRLSSFVAAAVAGVLHLAGGSGNADEARTARSAAVLKKSTPHLSLKASLSPTEVSPGTRLSLVVDVVPKRGMHVYAPGTQYRPIAVKLDRHPALRVHEADYPEPQTYLFKPLNERVRVYSAPFRFTVNLTMEGTGKEEVWKHRRLDVAGALEYQACDDRVCYLPLSVPLAWTVRLKPRSQP